jgi:UDP-3-O-[3-hydroxymyristoyl] glucosamine N-acyltransferase
VSQVAEHATAIAVERPRLEFARVLQRFFPAAPAEQGIHPSAVIADSAVVGEWSSIGPGAVIGASAVLGRRCRIGAHAVIADGCVLGDDVQVGPGTVIGYTGFGYERDTDGTPVLLPHSGSVRIGDRVEIGANAAIDRGTMDDTVVGADAKIDNLVHIAHNCTVGEGAFVIAAAVLCGGVQVGPGAWVAPNAAIREQLKIGAQAVIGLSSTVTRDVPDGVVVKGSPAKPVGEG